MQRRTLMVAVASAAVLAQGRVAAAEDTETVEYLFVQTSNAAELESGVLRLAGAADRTLFFSNRPERIVGRVATDEFVAHWNTGKDSFRSDPPNAVLTIHGADGKEEIAVVLRDPRLEGEDLVYDVEILSGPEEAAGEYASLFIDLIGRPVTPLSFAGVGRRARRRAFYR